MKVGDKVRVARMDEYTLEVYRKFNTPTRIGMEGVITQISHNAAMNRDEVVIKSGNEFWIWQPWQLDVIE